MGDRAPFLDVKSLSTEEIGSVAFETSVLAGSPFLSLYESGDGGALVDPDTQDYVAFLNELYDEEFDEVLSALVNEAAAIYETQFNHEQEDPQTIGYQAERFLDQHFAPLVAEVESMFEALTLKFSQRDPKTLTEGEIDAIVDGCRPSAELSPSFENLFGRLKNIAKTAAKKAVSLANKGVEFASKLGLAPLLARIGKLIKPLLQRVIRTAIGKLPPHLQPIAKKLASRLSSLKQFEASYESLTEAAETCEIAEFQYEFNQNVADLLFARTELEQDWEAARMLTEDAVPETYPLGDLDRARDRFVEKLRNLKEGEDPTPHLESFIPAILPALQIGIRLIGRKRVVDFLGRLLGKLIVSFVGPQHTPALSQAIVDAGLRLLQLEATPEDDSRAAASAVAATVEETVRRVAAAPEYVLDDQELLEGFVLEAFEHAAAANLPPILPEDTYKKRPDLGEAKRLRGCWIMMPRGRRKRCKKFSRTVATRFTPYKVSALDTFEGIPLDEFLEEQLGIAPGEEVEAFVHLYEAIPGTRIVDIVRQEESAPGLSSAKGHGQLHPLTRQAAAILLSEPELGRDIDPHHVVDPHTPMVGQRFYYLEIPGKRPLTTSGPAGRPTMRRTTRVKLILDFPKDEIRVHLFLSEIRAQEIAVKLRQNTHIGIVTTRLRGIVERGLRTALTGASGRMKIIHEAVTPSQWLSALRRLPSLVPEALLGRLTEWVVKGLSDHLKQRSEEFIKAAEDTADGVTVVITIGNPPGFVRLRQALKGNGLSLASLNMSDGTPTLKLKVIPGYSHE